MSEKWKKIWSKIATGSLGTFFTLLVGELLEEAIEEAISWSLTKLTFWFFSSVLIVTLTQTTKIIIKKVIKMVTYKEGDDKMDKLKKFLSFINRNKCTLGGIATGAVVVATGAGGIDANSLPALEINGFNITPILYYLLIGVLVIVLTFFPETEKLFNARKEAESAVKAEEAIEKEAQKQIADAEKQKKEEEKLAQKQLEEEEKAKKEAEEQAQKIQAEAERQARIDAIKKDLMEKNKENSSK